MNIKAVISFRSYREGDLPTVAQRIHDQLAKNAATFPALPVSLGELQTLVSDYNHALEAKLDGSKAARVHFLVAQSALREALARLGMHVNSVAKGDAVIVEKSGFPSFQAGRRPPMGIPSAPKKLTLKHGTLSTTVQARYLADRRPSSNEVQVNKDDPTSETDWKHHGIYLGSKALLTGLTPGTQIWVRVRTAGKKGKMGAWSDPAMIWVV